MSLLYFNENLFIIPCYFTPTLGEIKQIHTFINCSSKTNFIILLPYILWSPKCFLCLRFTLSWPTYMHSHMQTWDSRIFWFWQKRFKLQIIPLSQRHTNKSTLRFDDTNTAQCCRNTKFISTSTLIVDISLNSLNVDC